MKNWRFFDGYYYEEDAIEPTDDFYIDPRRIVTPAGDEWWSDTEIVDAINRQNEERERLRVQ